MKKLFGMLTMAFLAIGLTMSSCSKEEVFTDVDNFVIDSYKGLRDGPMGGHAKCYSVIFPVTLVFEDGTTQEVGDREELVAAVKAWKEANPDSEERPTLEFPISLETSEGDTIVVDSIEQVKELRKECRKSKNGHRAFRHMNRFLNNPCYKVELPIALVYENGQLEEINKRSDMIKLIKEWKENRPDEVPEIVYPITVKVKETEETVEIESFEDLQALVESCQ